jgi:hypothetical protein
MDLHGSFKVFRHLICIGWEHKLRDPMQHTHFMPFFVEINYLFSTYVTNDEVIE